MIIEKLRNGILIVEGNPNWAPQKNGIDKIELCDLIDLYKDDPYIPYGEYLRTKNWELKRLEILDRDKFRCQHCGGYDTEIKRSDDENHIYYETIWSQVSIIEWTDLNGNKRISNLNPPEEKPDKDYKLNVHHKKYIINRLPWDYNNEDLITLCNHCHKTEHENHKIPVYYEDGEVILNYDDCEKCGGSGYLPQYYYYKDGVCFKCWGTGFNIILINKN